VRVLITIDTEADNAWEHPEHVTVRNIDYIPRFQRLCDHYGLKPVYLCSYEVVASPQFDRTLGGYQQRGIAEIGAHLHPWTNPPFEGDPIGPAGPHTYPCELTLEAFRNKMCLLTEIIRSKTGRKPRSYRAGRWGFCARHIGVLLDLGYEIDCSVTPLISWEEQPGANEGGPDFRSAPVEPYFPDVEDVCRRGHSQLLEVPPTILFTSKLMKSKRFRRAFTAHRNALPCKALNKLFKLDPQWFRPYPHMSAGRLKAVCRAALRRGLPAVEMMFHSSELMPGGSPYGPTEQSIHKLYKKLESVFEYLSRQNCKGATLSEFKDEFVQESSGDTADEAGK